jgi:hypothetical protein
VKRDDLKKGRFPSENICGGEKNRKQVNSSKKMY